MTEFSDQQFILNIVNKIAQLYLQSYFIPGAYSFEDIFIDFLLSLGYTSYGR